MTKELKRNRGGVADRIRKFSHSAGTACCAKRDSNEAGSLKIYKKEDKALLAKFATPAYISTGRGRISVIPRDKYNRSKCSKKVF